MILSFSLDQPIVCDQLCAKIQNSIIKFQQESGIASGLILTIDVKQVTDSNQSLVPKIEFKN